MRKVLLIIFIGLMLTANLLKAQTKFGDNKTVINPNSVVEIESTNKGLLLPRVALTATTAAAPLTAHVQGMYVYNTATAGTAPNDVTPGAYYNDGTRWVKLKDTQGDDWHTLGNTGTIPPATVGTAVGTFNFWGTKDATNLAVGTSNITRAIFDQNGSLYGGNGTFNPAVNSAVNSLVWGLSNRDSAAQTLVSGQSNVLGTSASNSIVSGFNNYTNAPRSAAAGHSNIIYSGADQASVSGYNNKIYGYEGITSGRSNINYGIQAIVSGENNKDSAAQSIVSGYSNILGIGASTSMVSGYGNITNAPRSAATGLSNIVYSGADQSSVSGYNNKVYGYEGITSGRSNTNYGVQAIVSGDNNKDSANQSIVTGISNVLTVSGTGSSVSGYNNRVSGAYTSVSGNGSIVSGNHSLVAGGIHTVSGHQSAVFGWQNKDSANFSTVSGQSNTLSAISTHSSVSGYNNVVNGSHSSVSGYSNIVNGSTTTVSGGVHIVSGNNSSVSGWQNKDSANFTTVSGQGNSLSPTAYHSSVSGYYNIVKGAISSVSGNSNVTTSGSNYDLIAGTDNKDSSSQGSSANFITGISNHIGQGNTHAVWLGGYNNAVSGQSYRSTLYGVNNTITNCPDAYVFGAGINLNGVSGFYTNTVNSLGNVYYGGSLIATSDRRFKSNFKPLGYGLSTIMQLQPQEYDQLNAYRVKDGKPVTTDSAYTGSHHSFGLIAQDLYKVIPEAVNKPKDESNDKWGVDYIRLVPVLVKAIQDQQAQIRADETMIKELKAEMEAIKALLVKK